jgi:hypothetical protein
LPVILRLHGRLHVCVDVTRIFYMNDDGSTECKSHTFPSERMAQFISGLRSSRIRDDLINFVMVDE